MGYAYTLYRCLLPNNKQVLHSTVGSIFSRKIGKQDDRVKYVSVDKRIIFTRSPIVISHKLRKILKNFFRSQICRHSSVSVKLSKDHLKK